MNKYASDTMAFVLWLERRKLPLIVKNIFSEAENGRAVIYLPSMVFAEIGYLSEKNRIDTSLNEVKKYLEKHRTIKEQELSFKTVLHAFRINDIHELHDRLIAGTAAELNLKLITNDPVIK
jgi:predicted nucleic acid-binding protein